MLDCGGVRTSGTAVLVNTAGQRFVEELDRRDVVSKGILAQEGGVGYMVMTEADAAAEGYTPETYDETATMYANGTWVIGEGLEEVCEPFGIDPEGWPRPWPPGTPTSRRATTASLATAPRCSPSARAPTWPSP